MSGGHIHTHSRPRQLMIFVVLAGKDVCLPRIAPYIATGGHDASVASVPGCLQCKMSELPTHGDKRTRCESPDWKHILTSRHTKLTDTEIFNNQSDSRVVPYSPGWKASKTLHEIDFMSLCWIFQIPKVFQFIC